MFPVLRALKQECPANLALTEFYEVGQQKRAGKLMVAGSWNLRQTTGYHPTNFRKNSNRSELQSEVRVKQAARWTRSKRRCAHHTGIAALSRGARLRAPGACRAYRAETAYVDV
jgi:hypothetical protein